MSSPTLCADCKNVTDVDQCYGGRCLRCARRKATQSEREWRNSPAAKASFEKGLRDIATATIETAAYMTREREETKNPKKEEAKKEN